MKTVQEVLRELDAEKLLDIYEREYDSRLYRDMLTDPHAGYRSLTVEAMMEERRRRLQEYLERLCTLPLQESPESGPGIFFVYGDWEQGWEEPAFGLVLLKELMEKGPETQTYDYTLTDQVQVLGWMVADTPRTRTCRYELMADIMWELSYFGFEQQNRQELLDRLEASEQESPEEKIERIRQQEVREKAFENILSEWEEEEESLEKSPEEEALWKELCKNWEAYSNFSKQLELQKIWEAIQPVGAAIGRPYPQGLEQ